MAPTAAPITSRAFVLRRDGASPTCVAIVGWSGPVAELLPGGASVGPIPEGADIVFEGDTEPEPAGSDAGVVSAAWPTAPSSADTNSSIEAYRSPGFFASAL